MIVNNIQLNKLFARLIKLKQVFAKAHQAKSKSSNSRYLKKLRMYYIEKTLEISAAHYLNLSYRSKCENLHGHNWKIVVFCKSETLDADGMVVDFTHIKKIVKGQLDHKCLNDVLDCNPTAENIARWIADRIPFCYRVSVQESEGNLAIYEK